MNMRQIIHFGLWAVPGIAAWLSYGMPVWGVLPDLERAWTALSLLFLLGSGISFIFSANAVGNTLAVRKGPVVAFLWALAAAGALLASVRYLPLGQWYGALFPTPELEGMGTIGVNLPLSFAGAVLSLWLVVFFYRHFPPVVENLKMRLFRASIFYFIAAISILGLFLWLKALSLYSRIPFDTTTVFSLGIAGLAALGITLLFLQALFVWIHRLLMEVERSGLRGLPRIGALSAGILAALPVALWWQINLPLLVVGLTLLGLLGLFDLFIERRALNLTWMAVWMALLSAFAAFGLHRYSLENDRALRLQYAQKLTATLDTLAERELKQLAATLPKNDTLVMLLSTPVPFTVQEKALRREIAPLVERLPNLAGYYDFDLFVVNPALQQSVIEGQSPEEGLYLLRSLPLSTPLQPTEFYRYLLPLPDSGSYAGNIAVLAFRPDLPPINGAPQQSYLGPVSLFSGLLLLMIALTIVLLGINARLHALPVTAEFRFFDKPSLRNRIQLWLAGFVLGSFLLIGWVSYTFFLRSGAMTQDALYEYLAALLNLYVFLMLAALAVAVVAGNSITRPLAAIGEKLQGLRLGKNEPLEWSGQDELGELVEAYNKMILKVEQNAELLRRSEREGAWREMAKQVAHEIKNPLTPMKLSIQYLQRAHQSNPAEAAPLIKTVSETLIEQIDTLTRIAEEFSNFAQMPLPQKEVFDFTEALRPVFKLFQMEQQGQNVRLELELPDRPVPIEADRSQITRVLNNLLKNAIQAIPESEEGWVKISLSEQAGKALLSVQDNGTGIPEDIREKVFSPNFSTKTSGMGLGLAMCKNIVDAAGGRLWFETEMHRGTVFFVELPEVAANGEL
jgi:signal transduction histidine kinase